MTSPKCTHCDRPASVHETVVAAGGGVIERHLCRAHGLAFWRDALPAPPRSAPRGLDAGRHNRLDAYRRRSKPDGA